MSLRNIYGIDDTKSVNLPAAGASASTAGINIGTGPHIERNEVRVEVEALPSLADTKKATTTLEDSADGVTFAAIPQLAPIVQTGAGGAGAAAVLSECRLPSSFRGYLRATTAVEAAGGSNIAKKATVTVLS